MVFGGGGPGPGGAGPIEGLRKLAPVGRADKTLVNTLPDRGLPAAFHSPAGGAWDPTPQGLARTGD